MGNAASNKLGRGSAGGASAKTLRRQQKLQHKHEQQHYSTTTKPHSSKSNQPAGGHLLLTAAYQQQLDPFGPEEEPPPQPHLYDLDYDLDPELDQIWPAVAASARYYAPTQQGHVRNPTRRPNSTHANHKLHQAQRQRPNSRGHPSARRARPARAHPLNSPDFHPHPAGRLNPIYLDQHQAALDYQQQQQSRQFASSYDLLTGGGGLTSASSASSSGNSRSTAAQLPPEAYENPPTFVERPRRRFHQVPSASSHNLYNYKLHLHQQGGPLAAGPTSPVYEDCNYYLWSSQQQLASMHIAPAAGDGAKCPAASDARQGDAPATPPGLERGLAVTEEERQQRGLLGLLPAAVQDQGLQSRAVMNFIDGCQDELAKYVYLRNLKDFNEKLFYFTLMGNVQKLMPLVYTPTVGLACQRFSEIYMRPRGLFVTAKDAGRVQAVVGNWPARDVRVVVVTDGERILGLGDLGANGMGISIGKLSLYTALAGIDPQHVMPVAIDVGTNNQAYLADPFYVGLRQPRVRGVQFDALLEEFMRAVVQRWGRSCLIQFEDFANSTAFNLLKRYRQDYCTFNDDIQGTAAVALSGLMTAARGVGKRLADCTFLFYGAGEANLGTAQLLISAMADDGLSREEARRRIWLVDSKGLIVASRDDLNEHKRQLARDAQPLRDLEQIVDQVKPLAIIGASAQPGAFTESICRKMAACNEKSIIFALSNPTSKAECTAAQAYEWTQGRCVFASGSPFEPVAYGGRTYVTGQGNNAYIFPGVGLAAIGAHTHTVPEETFLVAARALSDQVTPQDTQVGLVYPSLTKIREVTLNVATRVLEYFYAERLATYRPEPSNKRDFLRGIQYDPAY